MHLGGFHTEMSFLGSIEQMLESIYAPNAVIHMLSARPSAFIVDAALNALMLHSGFNAPLPLWRTS